MSKNETLKPAKHHTFMDFTVNILVKGMLFGLLAGTAHLITYKFALQKLTEQN